MQTTTIKEAIEPGKSYYEIIPSKLGGVVLLIFNYGKVIFSYCYQTVFAAQKYVQEIKGVL